MELDQDYKSNRIMSFMTGSVILVASILLVIWLRNDIRHDLVGYFGSILLILGALVLFKRGLSEGIIHSIHFNPDSKTLTFGRTFGSKKIKISEIKSWGLKTYKVPYGANNGWGGNMTVSDFICTLHSGEEFSYPITRRNRAKIGERLEECIGKEPTDNVDLPNFSVKRHFKNYWSWIAQ